MKLRIVLILVAVLFLVGFVSIGYERIIHENEVVNDMCFQEVVQGHFVDFKIWEAETDDTYYLIIPSFFKKETAHFQIKYDDWFYRIYIDDVLCRNDTVWHENLDEEMHSIRIEDITGAVHANKKFQVLLSGKLPTAMIQVEAKEALYTTIDYEKKSFVEKGKISFFDADGNIMVDTDLEVFKVRGNSTAELDKKPFAFTLPQPVSLCGMEAASNWNLLANATDGSHIRNKMVLDWAAEISEDYQPESEFVEVFVNGEYQGLYLLTETIELSENRVECKDEGLLIEMDLDYYVKEGQPHIKTNHGHTFIIHSDIPVTDVKIRKVADYLNEIEDVLYQESGKETEAAKPLSKLIDIDSWTDMWLLREISSDHDIGTISQFAYMECWEEKSILKAGPAWDFDATFGNGMVPLYRNPRLLLAAMIDTKGIESTNQNRWLAPMYQNEEFRNALIEKYKNEFYHKISTLLDYEIDAYIFTIRRSALLDSLRWNSDGHYDYIYPPEGFAIQGEGDYHKYDVLDSHTDMVKNFLSEKQQKATLKEQKDFLNLFVGREYNLQFPQPPKSAVLP